MKDSAKLTPEEMSEAAYQDNPLFPDPQDVLHRTRRPDADERINRMALEKAYDQGFKDGRKYELEYGKPELNEPVEEKHER